jgi:hypothetical protein
MRGFFTRTKGKKERGMALLLTLFALLLLSAIGLFLVLASNTETRIDANYGSSLRAYYSARSGLEEVRDRIKYPSTAPGGLGDLLPQNIAGNTGGVLYVLNPVNGETVDPTDSTSPYFDDELCHDYASNTPRGVKCTMVPGTANWQLPAQASLAPASAQLGYKWIRINMKTNRIADPYFVDQGLTGAPLDTRVCWDGQAEQLSPGGSNPACDANGMQTVYMLTSLATPQANGPNGARKLLKAEVVAPSIRPAGVLTATAMNLPSGVPAVPQVAMDGRVHNLDGTLSTSNSCSNIASLATDTGSTQMEAALNQLRKGIVTAANNSCNADGTGQNGNICTPAMWWVRGTDLTTRFVTSGTSSGGGTPIISGPTSDSSMTSGLAAMPVEDDDDRDHDGEHHHRDPSGVGADCDPANPSCYTNLDLASPQLFATSASSGLHVPAVTFPANPTAPFVGRLGNQIDATIYQPPAAQTIKDQIQAVNNLVTASLNQSNYFTASSGTLAGSYGTSTAPAVVVFTDSTLSLQNGASLSGFGILVVPNALEITNATLAWNGIVLVTSSSGHVTINQGASGFINGALLLNPGATLNLQNFAAANPFRLSYSCQAVDLPFSAQPFKIISTTETSF